MSPFGAVIGAGRFLNRVFGSKLTVKQGLENFHEIAHLLSYEQIDRIGNIVLDPLETQTHQMGRGDLTIFVYSGEIYSLSSQSVGDVVEASPSPFQAQYRRFQEGVANDGRRYTSGCPW